MSDPTFHRAPRFEQEPLGGGCSCDNCGAIFVGEEWQDGACPQCWKDGIAPMTNTPSPTDELIERLRRAHDSHCTIQKTTSPSLLSEAADRLESLLSDRAKLEEVTPEMLWAGRQQAVLQCIRIEDFQMERIYVAMLKDALNRSTDRAT